MWHQTNSGRANGSGIVPIRFAIVVTTAVMIVIILSLFHFILFGSTVAAHGDEADEHGTGGIAEEGQKPGGLVLDEAVRQSSMRTVIAGTALLLLLVFASVAAKRKKRKTNPLLLHLLLWSIVAVVVAVTAYIAGSTIYLNVVSETAGPVHWHADFEVWRCGEPLQLIDPEGFSNRVGSSVLHEHGDNRMHIEGVVVDYGDVSIGSFFRSVGGDLHKGKLELPTNQGLVTMKDGDSCPDGTGTLQVFVLRAVNGEIVQQKLDSSNYEGYVPSPYGNVPPGDCLIFEFAAEVKDKTERMCESYHVALKQGAISGDADGG